MGYVLTTESNPANQESKEQPISDNELHLLISHNLGVLDPSAQYEESTKSTISQYGTKNLISQQKFNFLFMLDTKYADAIKTDKPASAKKALKHKTAEFSICQNENSSECILDYLFNTSNLSLENNLLDREGSLIKKLNMATEEQDTEIYFYTSDANTAKSYSESLLSLQENKNVRILREY